MRALLVLLIPFATELATASEPTAGQIQFFEQRVRPVLVEHCQTCHGVKDQKGGLRLDSRAALLNGGDTGPAISPGDPKASLLIEAINYDPAGYQMPPTGKLSADDIAALTEWVQQGAPWPGHDAVATASGSGFDLAARARHWSFQPVRAVPPPSVQAADWCRTPVDRFVLSKLEAAGLSPARDAEKRVLIRRVTYELTGLPPTPGEVHAFLADDAPDAYERLVDRLLASPRYGERWARHWLDLVRYAETAGHEFDYDIPYAWRYRDYVIRAFNRDLPYNWFIVEHLAGDLMPLPRYDRLTGINESVIGTGFYWFSQGKHSPVDLRAEECDTVDNQIDVIGKTFQGLTIACARCHDHKFDPIRQTDYYAFAGFLQSSRRTVTDVSSTGPRSRFVQSIAEHRKLALPTLLQAAIDRGQAVIDDLPRRLQSDNTDAVAWRSALFEVARKDRGHPFHMLAHWWDSQNIPEQIAGWKGLREREAANLPPQTEATLPPFAAGGWMIDGPAFGAVRSHETMWLFGDRAEQPLRAVVPETVWAHSGVTAGSLRGTLRSPTFTITTPYIDYLLHRRGGGSPGRKHKNGQVSLIIDGFHYIQNPLYGSLTINIDPHNQSKWYRQDVSRFLGSRAYIEIEDLDDGEIVVDRIEFRDGPLPQPEYNAFLVEQLDVAAIVTQHDLLRVHQRALQSLLDAVRFEGGRAIDSAAKADVLNWLFAESVSATPPTTADVRRLLDRHRQLTAQPPEPELALAMTDGTPEDEHLLIRGNPKKPGDPVPRRFLEVLQPTMKSKPMNSEAGGSGRWAWALCFADANNPLTARVLVNRLWQHHFDRGLVATPDDFGQMGQPPSHPELLDWLAHEFVTHGWSIKHMHRLLLLSATYRQTSRIDDAKAEDADPQNILLHRMNVQRLEAEPIRDALLALSGRLDDRMYGPSVPPHLTPFMEGRGRPSQSGPLDGNGRRSLYINVRRNFLSPMFLAFDFPTPFTTMGKRTASNVPAQALTLMNNPFVIQQAERWAQNIASETGDHAARVRRLYQTAFNRVPTDQELADAMAYLQQQGTLSDLAHVLLNVKEAVFIE